MRAAILLYVHTKPNPSQADLDALRVAGEKMQELLLAAGTSEDEIVSEVKKASRTRRNAFGAMKESLRGPVGDLVTPIASADWEMHKK